ncbi:MAG TPA: hypothetical protein VGI64_08240 [Streptosporangiaceae bacterium]
MPDDVGAGSGAAATLSQDERAELEQLRAEVTRLRTAGPPAAARPPGVTRARPAGRWRGMLAAALITLGCVLAPVSVLAVWSANQVSDTNRYVANVAPLIEQPAVRGALTDKISTAITTQLNVQQLTSQAATALTGRGRQRLASLLQAAGPALASGINGFVHSTVAKIVASPAVARLWTQVNRVAHAELVKALSGRGSGAIKVSNGQVTISLGPFINLVKQNLSARGFTLVDRIPAVNPTMALFSARGLTKAQTAYRLINALKWALPVLCLLLFAVGVYVARSHRRALLGVGLGLAGSMLVLGIALAVVRSAYLNSVPPAVLPSDAAAVVFDLFIRFIRQGLRVLLVLGLVIAAAAFLTGPSLAAVRTRGTAQSALGWLRSSGERAGLRTGPAGAWTYQHRRGLRVGAVALAGLLFVFWSHPTGLVVVLIAVLLVVLLGLIELIGRPPARFTPAG